MRDELTTLFRERSGTALLAALVDLVRPARGDAHPGARLDAALDAVSQDEELSAAFRGAAGAALDDVRLVHALVESGVLDDRGLAETLSRGAASWLLPPVHPERDARAVLARVFSRRDDWRWVAQLGAERWARLFRLALDGADPDAPKDPDLLTALRALATRIAASGIDEEIRGKLPEVEDYDSPFLELPAATHVFLERRAIGSQDDVSFAAARQTAARCRAFVERLRRDRHLHGTSLRLTRLTRRLDQQLTRFEHLLAVVHASTPSEVAASSAPLFPQLLEGLQDGHRLRRKVGQHLDLLAYQVTEQTAKKGEKYLGPSASAYRKLFLAALAGGALVGVFAIFQLFLKKLSLPLAGQAALYGLNYAVCFVIIYAVGATLATKQPAITASAIAKRLDDATTRRDGLEAVAEVIVVVWRNQFASFAGNLLFAFPAAFAVAAAFERFLRMDAVDEAKARALLEANHPFDSPTLFYAAIAGVFLFLSGLLQGAVENRVVYTSLERRLMAHPRARLLGPLRPPLVRALAAHAGGLTSNVVLGFLLGSAGVLGQILGAPLDIRHIAFSSAHIGVAVLDAPGLLTVREILVVTAGVLLIGFVNFVVSFGLTLAVTLKSRGVTALQGGSLLGILARRLLRAPRDWFLPPRSAP